MVLSTIIPPVIVRLAGYNVRAVFVVRQNLRGNEGLMAGKTVVCCLSRLLDLRNDRVDILLP